MGEKKERDDTTKGIKRYFTPRGFVLIETSQPFEK